MKVNTEQAKGLSIILVVLVVIVLAAILFKKLTGFFGGITDGIGITDTKDEKKRKSSLVMLLAEQRKLGKKSPFSAQYYRQAVIPASSAKPGQIILNTAQQGGGNLTEATAIKLAKKIYGAIGFTYDSPTEIAGAIKALPTKAQVSYLAEIFARTYGGDLLDWLEKKLDTTSQQMTLESIIQYVNKLPSGFTTKK